MPAAGDISAGNAVRVTLGPKGRNVVLDKTFFAPRITKDGVTVAEEIEVKDENATTWLTPKLVAEVKFTEWTSEGEMRHPAFLGLRSDKKVLDVIREQA